MSPVSQLTVLAFAAGAFAIPSYRDFGRRHAHGHPPHSHGTASGTAPASGSGTPFSATNSTGPFNATDSSSAPVMPSPVGPATVTVSPYAPWSSVGSSSIASAVAVDAASESTSTCTTGLTITTTERTYVTVTATRPSPSAVGTEENAAETSAQRSTVTVQSTEYHTLSFLTDDAPASTASPSTSSAPSISYSAVNKGYRQRTKLSSVLSSVVSLVSSVVPISSASPTTTSAVVVSVAPTTQATTTSAAAPASSSASTASPSGGKRGLAYNDASLTTCLTGGSHVSWGYNWGSSSSGLSSSLKYIPLLWGTSSDFTNSWSANAAAAIKSGSTHLFSFNEPDLSSQANLSPAAAAAAYKTYMMPFAGQAKLCAPSVTNGGGSMGLTWLANFMTACTGCQIDCVSIHWYDSYTNTDYFKNHVTNASTVAGGKEVFVSEFGTTDGTDANISTFLQTVMPWMDSNPSIAGYAYFMVSQGLLVSGSSPSSFGATYIS